MCSKSTRRTLSGGIEQPHLGQTVLSEPSTSASLIFCFFGMLGNLGPASGARVRLPASLYIATSASKQSAALDRDQPASSELFDDLIKLPRVDDKPDRGAA
jgi:hypothetical protein